MDELLEKDDEEGLDEESDGLPQGMGRVMASLPSQVSKGREQRQLKNWPTLPHCLKTRTASRRNSTSQA